MLGKSIQQNPLCLTDIDGKVLKRKERKDLHMAFTDLEKKKYDRMSSVVVGFKKGKCSFPDLYSGYTRHAYNNKICITYELKESEI